MLVAEGETSHEFVSGNKKLIIAKNETYLSTPYVTTLLIVVEAFASATKLNLKFGCVVVACVFHLHRARMRFPLGDQNISGDQRWTELSSIHESGVPSTKKMVYICTMYVCIYILNSI